MFDHLQALIAAVRSEQAGQGLVEYSLILGLIAVIAVAALTLLGANVVGLLSGPWLF